MNYYNFKMKLVFMNVVAIIFAVIVLYINSLFGYGEAFSNLEPVSLIYMILWMGLHELLHGVGFMALGEAHLKDIYIGAYIEKGIFYCMCKNKISKKNILLALLFPLFLIGIITYIIGIIINNNLLIFLSIVNIIGAIGDILMFIDIVRMPKDIYYLDLDDATGLTILSKSNLTKKKYLSFYLSTSGKYNDSMRGTNTKHITITKTSYAFIIFLIILYIFSLLD